MSTYRHWVGWPGVILFGVLGSSSARAEDPPGVLVETATASHSHAHVEEILVTSTHEDSHPVLRDQSKEAVTGLELRLTRGLNLAEALEGITGVTVLRTGNISKPVVNGRVGNRLSLINDGLRHENHKWGLEHGPEIDPSGAATLEVIRGAQGVRYGGDAVGGVVLLTSAPYPYQPGIKGSIGFLGVTNGQQGAVDGSIVGTLAESTGLSFRAQFSAKKAGSLTTPDYDLENTATDELNFSGAIHYDRDWFGVDVSFARFASNIGIFTGQLASTAEQFELATQSEQPPQVDLFSFGYDIDRPRQRVQHHTFKLTTEIDLSHEVHAQILYGFQRNDREEFDLARRAVGDRPQKDFVLDTHTLQSEVIGHWDDETTTLLGVQLIAQQNQFSGIPFLPNFRRWVASPYAIQKYVQDEFELELGLRTELEYRRVVDRERVGGANAPLILTELDYQNVVASASVLTNLSESFGLRFDFASAARAPTVDELFILGVSQGQPTYERGTASLGTETTLHSAAALGAQVGPLSVNAEGYLDYVNGYIFRRAERDPTGEPVIRQTIQGAFPSFVYDQTEAVIGGANLDAELTLFDAISWRGRAAFIRGQDVTSGTPLPLIPGDQFSNRLTLTADKLDILEDAFVWVESAVFLEQTRFDPVQDFTPPPPTYHLLSASIGATLFPEKLPVQLSVTVQNALDTRYRNYLSRLRYFADEPGLSIFVRLRLPFEFSLKGKPNEEF